MIIKFSYFRKKIRIEKQRRTKKIIFHLSWRVPWPILKHQRSFERLARLFVNFEDVAAESLLEQHRRKDNHKRQQSSPDL